MPYKNKADKLANSARYRAKNPNQYKDWAKANPEIRNASREDWIAKNPERRKEIQRKAIKKYNASHKEQKRKWDRQRRQSDPYIRMVANLRKRIRGALKKENKSTSSLELLGESFEVIHDYLTSLFKPGMTWENYGHKTWHIDHKIPCYLFDLNDPEQQKKCFHYTNLQPLWAKDNLSKGKKLI